MIDVDQFQNNNNIRHFDITSWNSALKHPTPAAVQYPAARLAPFLVPSHSQARPC